MKRGAITASLAFALLAACGGATRTPTGNTPVADPTTDKLAQVQARGTLVLFTDPEYPPQSFAVEGAERAAETLCDENQLTAPEISGYDAETGKLVAAALDVEPCFVTPSWTEVTAGNWSDRWDLAYGSGAIAADRMEALYMTQPYYSTPANFFVPVDSPAEIPEDLSGARVGACAGCTMEDYLRGTLELPGSQIDFVVDDPEIVTFEAEPPGLEAATEGEIDAFLCSEPVGASAIADGLALRMLETPAYSTYKTGYVDRSSGLDVRLFIERVNEIVAGLHADGTLSDLSVEYFGRDYAAAAAQYDIEALDQTVE
jgi:polar amino acid transport system substrate-binding protein